MRAARRPGPTCPFLRGRSSWKRGGSLAGAGCKVRSRALTTTLFARLLLADLFLHGIGGGKYDELTDELMRRFFGCRAAGFPCPVRHALAAAADVSRRRR